MTREKLRILVSIGGGPEAFAGLKFVHRLSEHNCADIGLLYVRPVDSGLKSGGMEVRVARENLLEWGLELPGMSHLNKAREILIELGEIAGEEHAEWRHRAVTGDPVGEFVCEYGNACGGSVTLRLLTAADVISAVVNEAERYNADMVIVGGSPSPVEGLRRFLTPKSMALKIAALCKRPVIVARHLEPGRGHLVCVQDSKATRAMLPKAVRHGRACACPISILSVAEDESKRQAAKRAVEIAASAFRDAGVEPHELLVEVGDPVETIVGLGYDFSLIVMGESEKPWFAKSFSVVHEVTAQARNSVMIIK